MRAQSERFGTTIVTDTVSKLDLSSKPFRYELEYAPGESHTADAVIIATGASALRLGLPGEDEFWQRGISACAVCDGALPIFRNVPVAVIGGGDSAAEEALFLTKYASKVWVLVRRDKLRASSIMAQRLASHPKVQVLYGTQGTEVEGIKGDKMTALKIKVAPGFKLPADVAAELHLDQADETAEKKGYLQAGGLFYAIGHEPATALIKGQIDTDNEGYIVTKPGTPLTSVEGVFAAGDCQDKRYRQAITSAGESY